MNEVCEFKKERDNWLRSLPRGMPNVNDICLTENNKIA